MTFDEASQRVAALRAELEHHNRLYYQQAAPQISDSQYDALMRELQQLEQQHPQLCTPDSPSQKVGGAPLESFASITHKVPMMSLDNTYSQEEVAAFYARLQKGLGREQVRCVIEPKVDGVAIALRYEAGVLKHAATRGDGRVGDDVTANVRTIAGLPLRLPAGMQGDIEVRGEVFIGHQGFARMNAEREEAGEALFANARNAAAGTLKLLDSRQVAKRPLEAIFYAVADAGGEAITSQREVYQWLGRAGLRRSDWFVEVLGAQEMLEAIAQLDDQRRRLPYDTDGAVVKVDEWADQAELGLTAKAPRWAMAYKYQPEQAQTRLIKVDIQVGRTGALTPVARLEPVFLSGSTVSNATLHNFEEVERKDIREGDWVIIEKAGEVIPAVVEVLKNKRDGSEVVVSAPVCCPVCGSAVQRDAEQVVIRCPNASCPEVVRRRLEHFVSRGAMDISGLGESVVAQLVQLGLVRDVADLYQLDVLSFSRLERVGTKSVDNYLRAIANSRQQAPWRLLFGLGILHVGAGVARKLLEHFGGVDAVAAAGPQELMQCPDIGEAVAGSLHQWFREPVNAALLERLRSSGLQLTQQQVEKQGEQLAGTTWVITGTLSQERETVAERIRAHGGRVSGSVSGKTSFVLAGSDAGSKLEKAAKLGVRVVSEAEFEAMLAG